jgi:tRNA (Thr-GGU) A37 N-methylase
MKLTPIGIIHTPFTDPAGMPIQPAGATGVCGSVEVFGEYRTGLKDLDGFSHASPAGCARESRASCLLPPGNIARGR